jgi:hypothetical protein
MAINTQELFRQKQVQFGAGSSPTRFTIRRSAQDLKTRSGVTSNLINDLATDSTLNAKYEPYLSSILDYHLLMLGHNPGMEVSIAAAARELAIRDAQMLNFQEDITQRTKLDLDS